LCGESFPAIFLSNEKVKIMLSKIKLYATIAIATPFLVIPTIIDKIFCPKELKGYGLNYNHKA
jgi:hypothetical protein